MNTILLKDLVHWYFATQTICLNLVTITKVILSSLQKLPYWASGSSTANLETLTESRKTQLRVQQTAVSTSPPTSISSAEEPSFWQDFMCPDASYSTKTFSWLLPNTEILLFHSVYHSRHPWPCDHGDAKRDLRKHWFLKTRYFLRSCNHGDLSTYAILIYLDLTILFLKSDIWQSGLKQLSSSCSCVRSSRQRKQFF